MGERSKEVDGVRISVVIPAYNSERTLHSCIRSVLNQSPQPWEIVIVDADSRDGTKKIAEDLARRNPVIRYYNVGVKGRGISSQKNYGAQVSTGDFVLFVDSDWYLDRDVLERLTNLAADGALCLVAAALRKKLCREVSYITRCRHVLWASSSAQSYLENIPYKPGAPVGNPSFIRRDIFLRLGGFDAALPALEDADLYAKCFLNGIHPAHGFDLGIHDQVITLKTIVLRRIRSAHATWAFEQKWGRTSWGRRARVELKKRHNIVLRWLKGIMQVARRTPRLLPGALLISIVDGLSGITARILWALKKGSSSRIRQA